MTESTAGAGSAAQPAVPPAWFNRKTSLRWCLLPGLTSLLLVGTLWLPWFSANVVVHLPPLPGQVSFYETAQPLAASASGITLLSRPFTLEKASASSPCQPPCSSLLDDLLGPHAQPLASQERLVLWPLWLLLLAGLGFTLFPGLVAVGKLPAFAGGLGVLCSFGLGLASELLSLELMATAYPAIVAQLQASQASLETWPDAGFWLSLPVVGSGYCLGLMALEGITARSWPWLSLGAVLGGLLAVLSPLAGAFHLTAQSFFVFGMVLGVMAIVLGGVAWGQVAQGERAYPWRRLAQASVVLGVVGLAASVLVGLNQTYPHYFGP